MHPKSFVSNFWGAVQGCRSFFITRFFISQTVYQSRQMAALGLSAISLLCVFLSYACAASMR